MGHFTAIFLLLTIAQRVYSESATESDETVELNWIETILLFPYCIPYCPDLSTSPLDELEEIAVEPHKKLAENILGSDDPEKLCAITLEEAEDVEETIRNVFEGKNPDEDAFMSFLENFLKWIKEGWNSIFGIFKAVFQKCVALEAYIQELFMCADYERTRTEMYNGIYNTLYLIRDEVVRAAELLANTISPVPCAGPPENTGILGCLLDAAEAYVRNINIYILATLITLVVILLLQYIRGPGASAVAPQYVNLSGNSRMRRKEVNRPSRLSNSPGIDTALAAVDGSSVDQMRAFKTVRSPTGSQKLTKGALEMLAQHISQSPNRTPSPRILPPQRPPTPRPLLVDAGSECDFMQAFISDVNEATDTSDLQFVKRKTPSPLSSQASPMPTSPVWIRYGSSPVKRHLDAKYGRNGRNGRSTSPIWERRASTDEDWKRAFYQKPRTPTRQSPSKRIYIPSPIYVDDRSNSSFDVDIGEPCCSSSFIEECLSESGRSRRDSGDSVHSRCLRPSVITKRYTKLKTGEFSMSRNSSAEMSMMMNVSDLNKSISLYSGDNNVFLELAFAYAFQNIFNRIRDLIAWSRLARTRKSHL